MATNGSSANVRKLETAGRVKVASTVVSAGSKGAARGGAQARRRLTPDDRRKQILQAAISYFAEVGFDGGTRDLARRLGVTQPLIYRYFPSKEDLIRQVYEEVYLGRWRTEWEVLISDRSIPLRDRLVSFYRSYTEVIFAHEWLRIYLFAGLRGLGINRWWITFVENHVLKRLCEELRLASRLPSAEELAIDPAEIDFLWVLHGGIFYNGMRRVIYNAEPHLDLQRTIEVSVDGMIAGFAVTSRGILKEKMKAAGLTK
jgi:AcrR family transcriptional regulator